jgi:hypothetical protein
VVDQQRHERGLVCVEAQARGDDLGELGAAGVVARPVALADVVQQGRHRERARVGAARHQLGRQREVPGVLAPGDRLELVDGAQDVLVDRVDVIEVARDAADHGLELGHDRR